MQIELSSLHLHMLNQQMPVGFLLEQLDGPAFHVVTFYFSAVLRPKHSNWPRASSPMSQKNAQSRSNAISALMRITRFLTRNLCGKLSIFCISCSDIPPLVPSCIQSTLPSSLITSPLCKNQWTYPQSSRSSAQGNTRVPMNSQGMYGRYGVIPLFITNRGVRFIELRWS